jgi:hypothetical protein
MIIYAKQLPLPVLRTLTPNEAREGMKFEDLGFKLKMEKAKE